MTPREFIDKWKRSSLTERASAQEHFIDLCQMLGQPTPAEVDPHGTEYTFERGAAKTGGGKGWADVWKRGHFAWEYKGKHRDLDAAYEQLLRYRESLENPPLLVVCDIERFQVHTNFTGTAKIRHEFALDDLTKDPVRRILDALFTNPERLRPGVRIEQVTEEAARELASLAEKLRSRGIDPRAGAHFLNRLLFCLFAQDVGMLPSRLFHRLLDAGKRNPRDFAPSLSDLFGKMAKGGLFGADRIDFFNGGLFSDADVIPLTEDEIRLLDRVADFDWGQIEPAIFGTLFERGLDPGKRSQLGAHYTDRGSILRVIEPVLMAPLRRDWADVRVKVKTLLAKSDATKGSVATRYRSDAKKLIEEFRTTKLDRTRVLDPACGSGNFLYVALEQLHELEKEVLLQFAEVERGQMKLDIRVGPHMVKGIEINVYAHELAQVTIWIGHFQWILRNGFGFSKDPVLKPIQSIECRDAILDLSDPAHPFEAEWPEADVVIGNPPFLGGKKMRAELGDNYVDALFRAYDDRVPREADLVTYWFEKARAAIKQGRLKRAGLLATQGIRGGASRRVIERILESGRIFMAWSDEPWIVEGANVRISLIGFDDGSESETRLDGRPVDAIHADLSASSGMVREAVDVTKARRLKATGGVAFMGDTKGGPFEIDGELAREWLGMPNPHGRSNSDVIRPWVNGKDITGRRRDIWIIDFGCDASIEQAGLYEAPFEHVRRVVKTERDATQREKYREAWWLHTRPRPEMRAALEGLPRFIATPNLTKHRLFVFLEREVLPDHQLIAFARDDGYLFGVLHSTVHERWARRMGTQLRDPESGCRYTPTTCFETFPFPPLAGGIAKLGSEEGDLLRSRIAEVASRLDALRESWLNPRNPDGTPALAEKELRKRTLTTLYNTTTLLPSAGRGRSPRRSAWLVAAGRAVPET